MTVPGARGKPQRRTSALGGGGVVAAVARVAVIVAAALVTSACPNPRGSRAAVQEVGDTSADPNLQTEDPVRELEIVLLENYLQLSLDNIEAYADSINRERDVMLVGVGPRGTVVGLDLDLDDRDRRPLRGRPRCQAGARGGDVCLKVLSKRLDVHVYKDQSAGWLSDEISYRVPIEGRLATIPLRMTAVFVRDIDRWTLVMEHMSYPLPVADIVRLARAGQLPRTKKFKTRRVGDGGRAKQLATTLLAQLNATAEERAEYRERMERKYSRQRRDQARAEAASGSATRDDGVDGSDQVAADRSPQSLEDRAPRFIDEDTLITLLPTPRGEFHDAKTHEAPSLAQLFGPGTRVSIREYRYDQAENKRVAWMLANLLVETRASNDEPVRIELRGTFLFAFERYSGWNLVQRHISVPIPDSILGERTFGPSPQSAR